jgi:hypothetical protein
VKQLVKAQAKSGASAPPADSDAASE